MPSEIEFVNRANALARILKLAAALEQYNCVSLFGTGFKCETAKRIKDASAAAANNSNTNRVNDILAKMQQYNNSNREKPKPATVTATTSSAIKLSDICKAIVTKT